MCEYVDYPPKYGHGFAVLCSTFAVSQILADPCDFFTHILLCCFAGGVGYPKYGICPIFSSQISNKNILIVVSFSCGLIQNYIQAIWSKFWNIYQGIILNLGLNHMQYAVLPSNQSKIVWFVQLSRNMNCAITYIYVHKKYFSFMTSTSLV